MSTPATPGPVPVDAVDPRLQFHGAWASHNSAIEGVGNAYQNGTYQISQGNGDYVTFDWIGGDVTIVGSTKPDHGFYSIILDSTAKQYFDGYSAAPVDKTILWTSQGLANGPHHVELWNENVYMQSSATLDRVVLDVDYVSYIPIPAPPAPVPAPVPAPAAAPAAPPARVTAAEPQPIVSSSTTTTITSTVEAVKSSSSTSSSTSTSTSSSTSSAVTASQSLSALTSTNATTTTLSAKTSTTTETYTYAFAIKTAITTGTPKLPARLPSPDSVSSAASRGAVPMPSLLLFLLLMGVSLLSVKRSR